MYKIALSISKGGKMEKDLPKKVVEDEDDDEEEDEDEEDDEDKVYCNGCKKDITSDDEDKYTNQCECSECEELFCSNCSIYLDCADVDVCKGCIDELYPRERRVVEKIVEKVVEVPKETIRVVGFSEPIL